MAIKILQYLSDNNNFERDGNVYTYICDGNTESRELEGDYEYVRESLEKDYRLIRRESGTTPYSGRRSCTADWL